MLGERAGEPIDLPLHLLRSVWVDLGQPLTTVLSNECLPLGLQPPQVRRPTHDDEPVARGDPNDRLPKTTPLVLNTCLAHMPILTEPRFATGSWSPVDARGMGGDHLPMALARALVGREDELATIDRLAAGVQGGGGCLVIRGAPGVGKSTLLEAVGDELSGRGWRVLRTDGTPSERLLPFAALHKLLRPIMGQANELLGRERDALLRAFGLVDGPAPGIFLVALAVLDLLAETATRVRCLS